MRLTFFQPHAIRPSMPGRLSFDHVARVYDETRGLTPRVMSRLLAVLVEELQGMRVLEIGVGTGRLAVPLQKSGVRVVGIDISRRMVEIGLAKGLRSVLFADGARLPIASKSFDVTMTIHVLHLIPDWRDGIMEIGRVTRDDDRLVKEAGHTWSAPGLHERDLPVLLRPDILMPVGPFEETLRADALLSELDGRSYSSQWDVPEPIHRSAMGVLRQEWGGREVHRSYALDVAFWRIDRLPEIATAIPQRS